MTFETKTFAEFVTERLEAFRDRTGMWGGLEAVEMQALLLIELEAFTANLDKKNPRIVLDAWVTALRRLQKFPYVFDNPQPLHLWAPEPKFGLALFELAQGVRRKLGLIPAGPV